MLGSRVRVIAGESSIISNNGNTIIYWMSRDIRIDDNWSLLYAQQQSKKNNQSFIVVFSLTFILSFFVKYSLPLQIAGGILFLVIAWRAKNLVIDENAITIPSKTLFGDFIAFFSFLFPK